MYKLGSLVHAPMNCTTFLCLTFLIIKTFLCKLFLYVWIYTLRLEDFNCHFLTMYVPLYRSPYELNATLFSNFNCLTSISRMPIPSLGIVTKSYLHLIHISSCSPIGDKKWWFGQDCFSILKLHFSSAILSCYVSLYGHPSQQRHLRCSHSLWKRHMFLGCWAQS